MRLVLKKSTFKIKRAEPLVLGPANISLRTGPIKIVVRDYHRKPAGVHFVQCDETGYTLTFPGLPSYTFYVHKTRFGFSLSEASTGMRVSIGNTALEALNKGVSKIEAFCAKRGRKAFDEVIEKQTPLKNIRKGYNGNRPED